MESSVLVRWSGMALIVSGVVTAVATLFHPMSDDPAAMASAVWPPVHILIGVGITIALFGLMGLYARQAENAGVLGLIGFIMAFSGAALLAGAILFLEGFVLPTLASDSASRGLVEMSGPLSTGPIIIAFLLTGVDFAVGFVLFGIATWMAGVLPRWGGLAMVIAGPLLGFTPPLPVYAAMLGAVVLGIGFVWMGYALWSGETEVAHGSMGRAA